MGSNAYLSICIFSKEITALRVVVIAKVMITNLSYIVRLLRSPLICRKNAKQIVGPHLISNKHHTYIGSIIDLHNPAQTVSSKGDDLASITGFYLN